MGVFGTDLDGGGIGVYSSVTGANSEVRAWGVRACVCLGGCGCVCLGAWICGCVGARECGCMGVCVCSLECGCIRACVGVSIDVWVRRCVSARECKYKRVDLWVLGCMSSRACDCRVLACVSSGKNLRDVDDSRAMTFHVVLLGVFIHTYKRQRRMLGPYVCAFCSLFVSDRL